MKWGFLSVLIGFLACPSSVFGVQSSPGSSSPFGGNGHNVSFDGRLMIVTRAPSNEPAGWYLTVLRPENVGYDLGGKVKLHQGAFAPFQLTQPATNGENAVALCEASPDNTPFSCNESGDPAAGPYACYDFFVFASNAEANQYNGLTRRRLKVWVSNPETGSAAIHKSQWMGGMDAVKGFGNADLRGIEPTVTRDGKLLVWQGHPDNDGKIDVMLYATNPNPCGAGGWDGPHNLSHMHNDPNIVGKYPLGEKQLRAADGTPFQDGDLVRGAYAWLFPEGDALIFTGTVLPCISDNNPEDAGRDAVP